MSGSEGATPRGTIRRLTRGDAEAYWHLRLEALEREPLAFGRSPEEHRATTVEEAAARLDNALQSVTLGVFDGDALAGIATLLREPGIKERHKAHLVGVYVRETVRGTGCGARLLTAVLDVAREDAVLEQVLLGVRAGNVPAQRLYQRLGFRVFGTEPRALKIAGEYVDEEQMILFLRDGVRGGESE